MRSAWVPSRITCVSEPASVAGSFFSPDRRSAQPPPAVFCPILPRRRSTSHCPKWAVRAEKYTCKPSLVKSGRQPGARICRSEWMTLCATCCVRGREMEHGQKLGVRVDDQPEKDARGESCAVWFAVHPVGDAGAAAGRRSVRARCAHARAARESQVGMVACRKPCDPPSLGWVQPFG